MTQTILIGLIPLIIVVVVVVMGAPFWQRMYADMQNNTSLSVNKKFNWTLAFFLMSFFAVPLYYFTEYRNRH